jgi:molybdenum cofactor guanylyltransferase
MTTTAASQPARASITGVVLAGGRALRMGGVANGLVPLAGRPLGEHALARLAPQVGRTMISANRHRDAYAAFGVPVLPDAGAAGGLYHGPLAGVLAGLVNLQPDWLVSVPCDTPAFPRHLGERLAGAARAAGARFAVAATRDAAGRLTALAYPNGVTGSWTYDAKHAVASWSYGNGSPFAGRSRLWLEGIKSRAYCTASSDKGT